MVVRPVVYVRDGSVLPFRRIARIRSAFNIHRAFSLMTPSQAEFSVDMRDSALNDSIIIPGNIVEIVGRSSSWYGIIKPFSENIKDSVCRVTCEDLVSQAEERDIPVKLEYSGTKSSSIFIDSINYAYRISPMVAGLNPRSAGGININNFSLEASSLFDSLTKLSDSSLLEWGVVVNSTPSMLMAGWLCRDFWGIDNSQRINIRNWHLSSGTYGQDPKGSPSSIRTIRPGVAVSPDISLSQSVVADRLPPMTHGDLTLPYSQSSFMASGAPAKTIYSVSAPDLSTIEGSTSNQLEGPGYGHERIELSLNTLFDWSSINVGDIVTVTLGGVRFGAGLSKRFRITGMQPDEDSGEMPIIGEVVPHVIPS